MITHLAFLPDFILPIKEKEKTQTRRPLKVQPTDCTGASVTIAGQDFSLEQYFCPFGKKGDVVLCHAEGNEMPFHEARIRDIQITRLLPIPAADLEPEGFENEADFLKQWDDIYKGTIYESVFNPYVWIIKWC